MCLNLQCCECMLIMTNIPCSLQYLLTAKIKEELKSWNNSLKLELLPTDATEFSYWVTHNLPLDNHRRINLLQMDCPIQRLRKQLEIMQKVCYLHASEIKTHRYCCHINRSHYCQFHFIKLIFFFKYGIMICNDCRTTIADKKDLFRFVFSQFILESGFFMFRGTYVG